MKIVTKVRDILNSMNSVKTVLYDSGFSANVRVDRNTPLPAALMYLLNSYEIDISKGLKKESASVQVFFFKDCPLDAKGEDKDTILSALEPVVDEFITLLTNSELKIDTDSVRIKSTYGSFDKFVIGYSVELELSVKQGTCIDSVEPDIRTLTVTENGTYDTVKYGKIIVDVHEDNETH